MLKAYKFRLYPTKEQIVLLEKHFGATRYIYNHFLGISKNSKAMSKLAMQKALVGLKMEKEWLNEINSQSLQVATHHLHDAYQKFFKKLGGYPKFKDKHRSHQSFSVPQSVEVKVNRVYIPKFKKEGIKAEIHRTISEEASIKQATVSRSAGKYFISILIEDGKEIADKCNPSTAIGIDMGLSCYIAESYGNKLYNPRFYVNSQKRLAVLQRILSRKSKDSNSRKRAKLAVSKLHSKTSNQRKDFLHNLSNAITKHNDIIGVETLNVKGMQKNRHLSKAISDASWSEFIRQLEYKSEWRGKHLVKIDKWFPSSKTCSHCGTIKDRLKLSHRVFRCDACGFEIDRDINASINIINEACKITKLQLHSKVNPINNLDAAGIAVTVKSSYSSISVQADELSKGAIDKKSKHGSVEAPTITAKAV